MPIPRLLDPLRDFTALQRGFKRRQIGVQRVA